MSRRAGERDVQGRLVAHLAVDRRSSLGGVVTVVVVVVVLE